MPMRPSRYVMDQVYSSTHILIEYCIGTKLEYTKHVQQWNQYKSAINPSSRNLTYLVHYQMEKKMKEMISCKGNKIF